MSQICGDGMTAYRTGINVQDLNLARAMRAEDAILGDGDVWVASFDLQKAFDHIPHKALARILQRTKLPGEILALVKSRLEGMQQKWKVMGSLSPATRTWKRGLVQGW